MANIGTLSVSIAARTKKFRAAMKRAKKSIQGLKAGVAKAAAGFALAGGGLAVFVKSQFSAIDSAAKFADVIGLTTEALAGYRLAAEITGVEQSQLNTGMARFQKNIGDAEDGLSTSVRALGKLGLTFKDLKNLTTDDQLKVVADRFNNLSNQVDKSNVLLNLFGRSGLALGKLLQEGSAGINRFQEEAAGLGVAFNRVDAGKVELANDAMTRLKTLFTGAAQTIAIELAPKVLALAEMFITAAKSGGGMGVKVQAALVKMREKLTLVVNLVKVLQLGFNVLKLGILKAAEGLLKLASFTKLDKLFGKKDLFKGMADDFAAAADPVIEKIKTVSDEIQGGSFGKKLENFMVKADAKAESMTKNLRKATEFTDASVAESAAAGGKAASFKQVDLARVSIGGVGSGATTDKQQLDVQKDMLSVLDQVARNTKTAGAVAA